MKQLSIPTLALAGAMLAAPAWAQQQAATVPANPAKSVGLYAYPRKEQSATKQSKDEKACYTSAMEQSGVDPQAIVAPTASSPPRGRRTLRGAAGGAAIGAIAGSPATGAAVGAAAGGLHGRQQAQQQAGQAQQQAQQAEAQTLDSFKRVLVLHGRARLLGEVSSHRGPSREARNPSRVPV